LLVAQIKFHENRAQVLPAVLRVRIHVAHEVMKLSGEPGIAEIRHEHAAVAGVFQHGEKRTLTGM
jgi:hypothetical protein